MNEKEQDKPDQTPEELLNHRLRMRFDWNNLVEDLIEDGKNQGIFNDLPGKGKPLKIESNLYAPDKVLANKLLKDNDLRPAWIMNRNRILEQKEQLRADIQKTWTQHRQAHRFAQGDAQIQALVISWDDACRAWEAEIKKLNKQIDDFNLKRPVNNLELFKLRFDEELKRVEAPRYL